MECCKSHITLIQESNGNTSSKENTSAPTLNFQKSQNPVIKNPKIKQKNLRKKATEK